MINPLAKELNDTLAGSVVDALMSDMGRRLYFPNGIISQGGEAAKDAHFANGTIVDKILLNDNLQSEYEDYGDYDEV